jgi:hypothetical protein
MNQIYEKGELYVKKNKTTTRIFLCSRANSNFSRWFRHHRQFCLSLTLPILFVLPFFDRLDFLEEAEGSRFADKKILTKIIYRICFLDWKIGSNTMK